MLLLFLRAHNKTRQIRERLRDAGCCTEVHSLKVMHCKIAFLLRGTFILCDGCRLTVSANRVALCVLVLPVFQTVLFFLKVLMIFFVDCEVAQECTRVLL